MVETTTKQVLMLFFFHFGAIWAPPNGPKKVLKDLQVEGTYGPMSKLKNKPLTKLFGPFFKEKWSETIRKQVFMLFFFFISGPLGHPQMNPKRYSKVCKWARYGPMSQLENKPLSKLLGPFF